MTLLGRDAHPCGALARCRIPQRFGWLALLVAAFLFVQPAAAQTCMEDNWLADGNTQNLNCNAKEVFINRDGVTNAPELTATVVNGDDCEFPGDTATVSISANIHFNADRFDVGVYSALDGGDALSGQCAVDVAPFEPSPFLNADGGADVCGDVDCPGGMGCDTSQPFQFQELTLTCVDNDGDGKLDWTTCFSWRQSGGNELCTGPSDIFPGSPSKCFCETINLNEIPVPKTIEVTKVTVGDPTATFEFQVDGQSFPGIVNGGSTGKVTVTPGQHTVSETPNPAYSTSISCVDKQAADPSAVIASCVNCTSLQVTTPDAQSDIVCTVTNTDLCVGIDCNDGNVCTTDSCVAGQCINDPAPNVNMACGDQTLSVCDEPNTCDTNGQCSDNFVAAGVECRPAAGLCDVAEACDGVGSCAPDGFAAANTICRAGSGDLCDPTEVCDGQGAFCPADVVASAQTVCNPGSGDLCDPDELCTGVHGRGRRRLSGGRSGVGADGVQPGLGGSM